MALCKHRTEGATLSHSLCSKKKAILKRGLWFSYFTPFLWMTPICNACFCLSHNSQIPQLQELWAHESWQIRPLLPFPWNMLPSQMGCCSRIEITNDSVTTWKAHGGREERDAIHFSSANTARAFFLSTGMCGKGINRAITWWVGKGILSLWQCWQTEINCF